MRQLTNEDFAVHIRTVKHLIEDRTMRNRILRLLVLQLISLSGLMLSGSKATAADATRPIAAESLVFAERDGLVAVEAEHFVRQELSTIRAFHITTSKSAPSIEPDGDSSHVADAVGGAYVEVLPDSRRNHGEKLIHGENFSNQPGKLAVLTYKVHFENAGRFYVWVRAFSSGSEDNGLHVGINESWPESGRRLQWCDGKNSWRWESKQRTDAQHCGEPHKIYLDVPTAGVHDIHFSMREDGFEFDRWLMTKDRDFARPDDAGPAVVVHSGVLPVAFPFVEATAAIVADDATAKAMSKELSSPTTTTSELPLQLPRQPNGNGSVKISGELKQWHKVTLTLDGVYAHELDNAPNPFVNYQLDVTFTHESGSPKYTVPGYFAADGDAANTSAQAGTKWRAHLSPDKAGRWNYSVSMRRGTLIVETDAPVFEAAVGDGANGSFEIAASDKQGRDLRAHGRLQYVGQRYLKFADSGKYFLKAGADAPETLLGYADFDGTVAGKPAKAPLKRFAPHLADWKSGDPSWQDGKGKGLIGAINYLSGKGCNAFSFLTYNAGGDGDNVWPFVQRDDKLHYDCSKLDQWGIVFDHGTAMGMYLHFKMQETENDDHTAGKKNDANGVPECLDNGDLGMQRRLYCRELIARYGHNLALNWNLGEENTQSTRQQISMIDFISRIDAYQHNIVIHTFPEQQDKVYRPLLGAKSALTGVSLQNGGIHDTHWQVAKWVRESQDAGKPWIVAFDESGTAAHGQCPDLGYQGYDGHDKSGKMTYTEHEVRQQTLWGTLMAGGAGVEYYFGYQYAENDLVCEDWRSRDRSWDYCRIAIEFFPNNNIPFWEMINADTLVGNPKLDNSKYCLAKANQLYLVYLPHGGTTELDLTQASGDFQVYWFNPRSGGELVKSDVKQVVGGASVSLGQPPLDRDQDWLVVIQR